ncbi:MAG TPA: hypothetical protein VEG32_04935 [Clostridia bacterium]|nr:hypothetical protein [Clostridia bacterium]
MTAVEVVFSYGTVPTETVMRAVDDVREVYGIRLIRFSEADRTVRVEYDATRLKDDSVSSLLRNAGLDLRDKLSLV